MSAFYPEESKKLDILSHLEELRRRILFSLGFIVICSVLSFANGEAIMRMAKAPIRGFSGGLIFIGPTEGFVSYLKLSLLAGFIAAFPFVVLQIWFFLAPAFKKAVRSRIRWWLLAAILLFFAGEFFSYTLALPAALKFLLSFGERIAEPSITIGKYVSFFCALMLVGGVVFELPVVMGLFAETGLVRSKTLREKRPYAYLGILAFAAIITPTQDIMNMLIFSFPMFLLFEAGLIITSFIERNK
ncbi:MAG: twin-arginine translocase subunit TatC [Candidatus Omnitrophica bacterium]|nr:twin-arginine translocase subunit TatC [Candidatus Omnitrophota bacterium]